MLSTLWPCYHCGSLLTITQTIADQIPTHYKSYTSQKSSKFKNGWQGYQSSHILEGDFAAICDLGFLLVPASDKYPGLLSPQALASPSACSGTVSNLKSQKNSKRRCRRKPKATRHLWLAREEKLFCQIMCCDSSLPTTAKNYKRSAQILSLLILISHWISPRKHL